MNQFMRRTTIQEQEEVKGTDEARFEDIISNESYASQTLRTRNQQEQLSQEYKEDSEEMQKQLNLVEDFNMNDQQYVGRMSPHAKEELYLLYQKGMTVKDLSLKYGILPQRVKAIVFQKHLYWNEVYPKLGETHQRLALEREALYAKEFPFVDYGIDLKVMADMEKGIELRKIKRSDIDANPPQEMKKKIEKRLQNVKSKTQDYIPIGFVGKGGKGYVLKEMVKHRGLGSPMVNKDFKDAVRLMGTENEHQFPKYKRMRAKMGGIRYASMGN